MRKGGTIIFYNGSLKDDNGDTLAEQSRRTVKGQNKERFTLACRAFIPTNVNLFTPDIFASAATPSTAGSILSESAVRADLATFMQFKVNRGLINATQRDAAMAKFDDAVVAQTVPEANMRAALVSLIGTLAEPAIDAYLTGDNLSGKKYSFVGFGTLSDATAPVAQTIVRGDGRLQTVIRTEFRGEAFQAISAWLAHEALHQDNPTTSLQEEMIATTVGTMVYGQQIDGNPDFTADGTQLVNIENEKLLAFVNSGRAIFPYVGIKDAPMLHASGGVFQGQKAVSGGNYTSYDNFVRRYYLSRGAVSGNSPGNDLFNKYYTAITGAAAPASLGFGEGVLTTFDNFQAPISTRLAVKIAQVFKLRVS
jgi:hypothetical protein